MELLFAGSMIQLHLQYSELHQLVHSVLIIIIIFFPLAKYFYVQLDWIKNHQVSVSILFPN